MGAVRISARLYCSLLLYSDSSRTRCRRYRCGRGAEEMISFQQVRGVMVDVGNGVQTASSFTASQAPFTRGGWYRRHLPAERNRCHLIPAASGACNTSVLLSCTRIPRSFKG